MIADRDVSEIYKKEDYGQIEDNKNWRDIRGTVATLGVLKIRGK